ncbi:MAG: hypothetical protein M3Q30_22795 [Actinomycetota bacterium]|nr:hypothetical protein [Actinomycetota bacterium]
MDDSISVALREALAARAEIAYRSDRCRAALGDILGDDATNHRREVALLVAAVEEHVPEALRGATSQADVDSIASRFREERSLESDAARWAVDVWSDALRSVGVTSIPTDASSEGDSTLFGGMSDAPASATTAVSGAVRPSETVLESRSTSILDPDDGSSGGRRSPPARRAGSRRRLMPIVIVLLIAIGAGSAYFLTRPDDHRSTVVKPGRAPTTTMGMTDATAPTGTYPNSAERDLLKHAPQSSLECMRYTGKDNLDEQLAHIECTGHGYTVEYFAFASPDTMRDHFAHQVKDIRPKGGSCLTVASSNDPSKAFQPAITEILPRAKGVAPAQPTADAGPGQLLCFQKSGTLLLWWTNEKLKILARAATEKGDLDAGRMFLWWTYSAGPCDVKCSADT